jgi:hypothetical protein
MTNSWIENPKGGNIQTVVQICASRGELVLPLHAQIFIFEKQ